MCASGVSNPLDIIKVRQQLRTQSARANSFWVVGIEMARSEGLRSLMNGFSASMLREFVYSGIRLGSYEYFKDAVYQISDGRLSRDSLGLKVAAASIASTIGSALANPADLVKVRMQAYYPSGTPYRNMRHAFATIWKQGSTAANGSGTSFMPGGLRALYRGVSPTTVRGVILSTSQICSYDQVKQVLKRRGVMEEGIPLHLTASMFAGLFCSITSNPVDVVKVRLMNDHSHQYNGVTDCIKTILRSEGPVAFYKGFGMCWARLGTVTIVTFVVFERIRLLFGVAAM
ncbi:mitochondrial carrier [Wolfiporia cocos MD-104 SS10]|uniref:Mitochondrial carrier n=1 Tax=Wolfiporia cocos (strain MD-104) TaxID=742152 RepID=A0A2H3JU83_WOLCO|nr:mitochondrial carrier [Wolfiporia cocos MD-104 SS10]